MPPTPPHPHAGPIALLYDDDAYLETLQRPRVIVGEQAAGLMGRQVAGKEFLDAYLGHGTWTELVALVRNRPGAETLRRLCRDHPSSRSKRRRLRLIDERHFHDEFLPRPPASPIHFPCPPDSSYAWARQRARSDAFALCGVTHTLCSAATIRQLCDLVTAPFEAFDALVCTSTAVVAMVRAVTETYAEYLRDRHGGTPGVRVRLEQIPLGVDTDRFHPATPAERAEGRATLGIGDEEVAVLFVGRLSHHAKAHPFPMFHGVARAARETGRAVHLLLAGWAANQAVHDAFVTGARAFAPGVRVTIVDGTRPGVRSAVWHAADVFTSLSDNIQETFGLVVVEALACGLPVVASDWDGYRDLVDDGETGYLVPTVMVEGATREATSRLLMGEVDYDHFLAECSQAVAVDLARATEAYGRLIADAALRRGMGEAGRRRALERFAWPHIIRAYEALWADQEADRLAFAAGRRRSRDGPALYPDPERSFRAYPTHWLRDDDLLEAVAGAADAIGRFLTLPLTNHVPDRRASDPNVVGAVLAAAAVPTTIAGLDAVLHGAGLEHRSGRATLAWMLKYGLLRRVPGRAAPEP